MRLLQLGRRASGHGKEIRHVRFAGGALTTALPSRAIVP